MSEKKYSTIETIVNERIGEEYQKTSSYKCALIPIFRFIMNRNISSVYCRNKKIMSRNQN